MAGRKISLTVVSCFLALVAGAHLWTSSAFIAPQSPAIDFAREIQPILQAHCSKCHGAGRAMGGLRLDRKDAAMRVITPGRSSDSRIIHRLLGEGGEERMPLGGPALPAAQIDLIRRWIDAGAQWPDAAAQNTPSSPLSDHWAYNPPQRPALPEVKNKTWAAAPIDRFILARLEKEKLSPSPVADRATLLRRLSLDLIGLPPTPEEVDAFLRDTSPRAYEKQVDRLLASPHYGERWGRQWLDAARYADSDGYEKDKSRQVWLYRDWVIRAFNEDKPYDKFIIEQIAGDLLPGATQQQHVATGFLRNSMINEEGGVDPEQFRMEAMFDRMDAIGKSVLGLTIQCAQCHNHKYDPLRHEEYYRLFSFLNNSHEAQAAVYTPEEEMKRAEIFRKTREIEGELQHRAPDWEARMSAWEEKAKRGRIAWKVLRPTVNDISTGGSRYLPLPDDSFLAQGYAPTKHRVKFVVRTDEPKITGFRVELLTDPNLPLGGPGRSVFGTGVLTEFEVEAAPADAPDKITKLKIARATADYEQPERPLEAIFDDRSNRRRTTGPVSFAIDGLDETAWGIDAGPGRRNQPRQAVFTLDRPLENQNKAGLILNIYLKQNHGGWNSDDNQNNNLGRVRLALATSPDPAADPAPAAVAALLDKPRDKRTPAEQQAIFRYWRTTVPEWKDDNARIDALWREHPEGSSQLVLAEREEMRRTTHLLKRGDFLRPDKEVAPGVPAYLHPLPEGAPPNRLGLARWLVDRRSPTTARAAVNRIWQTYFGTGLTATPEDFGRQGERPSHPELLDWLSVELMENGWSLKHIHRSIVNSATYRQSSHVTPELRQRDPDNRLLARAPRLRVEAEIVRDIALQASGLLSTKVGGPSVFPPSPEFLYLPPTSYGPKIWREEKGEDRYRRAIYTFRYRSVPYPMLQVFDAPPADVSCVRRARSNTPLQALVALNETLFLEAARALAWRTVNAGGATNIARVNYAFRRVLARRPTAEESQELLGLWERQRARFISGEANPWNLAVNDPDRASPLPKGVRMEDVAAWTAVARVLLNLDETITKE